MNRPKGSLNALFALAALLMAGCDAGPSAVAHTGASAQAPIQSQTLAGKNGTKATSQAGEDLEEASMPIPGDAASTPPAQSAKATHLDTSVGQGVITATQYGQWPLWSKNRKYSADDNAHYHFTKHGAEFGAKTYADYVAIVHGFIHNPPPGTQTLKRSNGDTLFYDPKQNIFAVMSKAGAPRTFFHPDNGQAYWQQQKQVESTRRTITRDSYGDDN